uniref:Peptidase metallopeptidase domain-containing protein n=1 Tax=Falco tinnunculus TaxID=100819 RepID=A0A8C4XQV5_FALTI
METLPFLLLLCTALSCAFPAAIRQKEGGMQLMQVRRRPKKVKEMQEFFGLEVMGKLDSGTLDLVQKCCCGFPDVAGFSTFTEKPKWAKQVLTYRILKYTPDLSVTPLKSIKKGRGDADIMISFAARVTSTPFHVACFVEDETWTKSKEATNLFYVAAHEFGHSLGLFHSKDPNVLIYAVCRKFDPSVFPLHQDDINYLYDPTETKDPSLFLKVKWLGVIFKLYPTAWKSNFTQNISHSRQKDKNVSFKGDEFWVVRGDTIIPGYPQKVYTPCFSKGVTKIDAAFYNRMSQLAMEKHLKGRRNSAFGFLCN